MLCEQGGLEIHPYIWMTMRALILKEFQPAMLEFKTKAGLSDEAGITNMI